MVEVRLLSLDSHTTIVADTLVRSTGMVEESRLATIRIAYERYPYRSGDRRIVVRYSSSCRCVVMLVRDKRMR